MKKSKYKEQVKALRAELIQLQIALKDADFPVLIVISGDDRSGRHETLNLLHEWMDSRFLQANAYGLPTEEEQQKPFMWRYWKDLPQNGVIGLCLRDWTSYSIIEYLIDQIDEKQFTKRIEYSNAFEATLTARGMLIIKIWLHLPEEELKHRLKIERKYLHKVWQIHQKDQLIYSDFDRAKTVIQKTLKDTDSDSSSWHIIESSDLYQRNLHVGKLIAEKIRARLNRSATDNVQPNEDSKTGRQHETTSQKNHLDTIDLSKHLDKKTYKHELKYWQHKASHLIYQFQEMDKSCVIVFEGWDAAGKGGCIRRLTSSIDAGFYRVIPVAAPTDEESAHHYLWRFWRKIPRAGRMSIFDRSWYGRVLVERVEGFASDNEWQSAYDEINDFERQLHDKGIPVIKFWLHIDKEEQLERFKERETIPYKHHKITEEDYRNREKWTDYEITINDMIDKTSTSYAPWRLIPSNSKHYARIEVLKHVCNVLEKTLKDSSTE
ncbi:polyphosphate:AMP phosphotransferase [Litoribrevibacter albus]|uniref:Polyphosphate:AMP phosphotransferase n=1 Tax=Litoribrevibacter albus TaxID=1473156 RepID=A0AA37SAP3_9GAMM|nr:polyphosphate:AMP phosphotransferase [Litoribrevibacter albus]GLQ32392.1 polyphosphate:AMP phosphotransferase [Litoribrevibacter albus]